MSEANSLLRGVAPSCRFTPRQRQSNFVVTPLSSRRSPHLKTRIPPTLQYTPPKSTVSSKSSAFYISAQSPQNLFSPNIPLDISLSPCYNKKHQLRNACCHTTALYAPPPTTTTIQLIALPPAKPTPLLLTKERPLCPRNANSPAKK